MKILSINPLTSLPTNFIKINQQQKRFANTTCPFSSAKKIKQKDNNNNSIVTSIESVSSFYPSRYIDKYISYKVIKNAVKTNPNITKILNEHGLTPRISRKNIDEKAKMHMFSAYMYAKDIAKTIKMKPEKANILYQAALLHDIGKALIPERIVQKPGELTKEEREIINLHAELGYEILKTTDVPEEVAKLVKAHHESRDNKLKDITSMILSVVDVFSALKEKRVYKPAMKDKEAFEIMASSEKLSPIFVHVLRGSQHKKAEKEKNNKE